MSSTDLKVIIVPEIGRIIWFSRPQEKNVLWVHPDAPGYAARIGGWRNWGGDKIWPWPQEKWKWPPPPTIDEGPYDVEISHTDHAVVLRGPVDGGMHLRAVRTVCLEADGKSLTVRSHFEASTDARTSSATTRESGSVDFGEWSSWSVTQVDHPDFILAHVADAASHVLSPIGEKSDVALRHPVVPATQWLGWRPAYDAHRKAFVAADLLAAHVGNVLFVQRRLSSGSAQDDRSWRIEESAQFYHSPLDDTVRPPGTSPIVELEFVSPHELPKQIGVAELVVEWRLISAPPDVAPKDLPASVSAIQEALRAASPSTKVSTSRSSGGVGKDPMKNQEPTQTALSDAIHPGNQSRSQLAVRLDDVGLCPAANRAAVQLLRSGIAQNVSVMAPPPGFDDAVASLRPLKPEPCIGLHLTLNCEWAGRKWKPVADEVPTLVGEDGCLFATPDELAKHHPTEADVEREIRAQLAKLRAAGLRVSYIDEHMGVGWTGDIRKTLRRVAAQEKLIIADDYQRLLPQYGAWADATELTASLAQLPEAAQRVAIVHAMQLDDDARSLVLPGLPWGREAESRDGERRLWLSPEFQALQRRVFDSVKISELSAPSLKEEQ